MTETINSKNNHYDNAKNGKLITYLLNQATLSISDRCGSRVRARKLAKVKPHENDIEVIDEISIEVENKKRLACVAETV